MLPPIVQFSIIAKQALDHNNYVEDRQLHVHFWQLLKLSVRDRFSLPVFEKQINDEVAMDTVSRKTDEHTQIADRPNNVSEASLHGSLRSCQWLRQQGRHDAVSSMCVKSKKNVRLLLKMTIVRRKKNPGRLTRARMSY